MSLFKFQRFSVQQLTSAMKVCTDATLFGAMAPVAGGERVLDIGAGSGLLSLMLMQLGAGRVSAVELTAEACSDARVNFANSPWATGLSLFHQSIQEFARDCNRRYDLIISNPPFFERHSKSQSPLRQQARHSDRLTHRELIDIAARLLDSRGRFYLLIPLHAVAGVLSLARAAGLSLLTQTEFAAFHHTPAKVAALTFGFCSAPFVKRQLVIYTAPRIYTDESAAYLSPFLLRFATRPETVAHHE